MTYTPRAIVRLREVAAEHRDVTGHDTRVSETVTTSGSHANCLNCDWKQGLPVPNPPAEDPKSGHAYYRCPSPCDRDEHLVGMCVFCEGGLSSCVKCGQAEGDLEARCPKA